MAGISTAPVWSTVPPLGVSDSRWYT